MELTVLGSGTYQPTLDRHPSSYLVKTGNQNLIFDFGRGVLDQLMKLGIQYYDIDAIFISHLHADHSSELSSLLHIALAEPAMGKKRRKKLFIYGPQGLLKTYNYILKAFELDREFKPKYPILVKELSDEAIIKDKGWLINSYTVEHGVPNSKLKSLAYRFISGKKILAYSGDCGDCPGLHKAVKNADLAIIEASWPKELKPKMHLTANQAGQIAEKERVKKLVLTHISPYYLSHFNVKKIAQKYFHGFILIANDLMKIRI